MVDEVERKNFSKKDWVIALCILVAVCGAIGGFLFYKFGVSHNPIPEATRTKFALPILYPSSIPDGYRYEKDSARLQKGVLFYKLTNGDSTISFSQQISPQHDPGLEYLVGFSPLETPIGKAYSGKKGESPTVLLLTDRTFVTITSGSDVPANIVSLLAKKLEYVE
jgi:hypothetical protein